MARGKRGRGGGARAAAVPPFGADHADWAAALTHGDALPVATALAKLAPNPPDFGAFLPAGVARGAEQIAAEQLGHLLDGWRFLSSAFFARVTNSPAGVVHYAYYAELRAAFSLMASTGLRVKWRDSYYVDAAGAVHALSNWQTHECVWKVWPQWLSRSDVVGKFQANIKLHPLVPLQELMQEINSHLGAHAIKSWGLDLLKPASDHDFRNTASYESAITSVLQEDISPPISDRFRKAWELMLPNASSLRFDEAFSAYLLYVAMKYRTGADAVEDVLSSEVFERMADVLSRHFGVPSQLFAETVRANSEYFEIFELASTPVNDPDAVMIRALFLLRVAAAFAKSEVPPAAPIRDRLKGWLARVGVRKQNSTGLVSDIAKDYEDALDDLQVPFTAADICGARVHPTSVRLTRADAVVAWAV